MLLVDAVLDSIASEKVSVNAESIAMPVVPLVLIVVPPVVASEDTVGPEDGDVVLVLLPQWTSRRTTPAESKICCIRVCTQPPVVGLNVLTKSNSCAKCLDSFVLENIYISMCCSCFWVFKLRSGGLKYLYMGE